MWHTDLPDSPVDSRLATAQSLTAALSQRGDFAVRLDALGETQVVPHQANPKILEQNWYKFCALRRVWEYNRTVHEFPDDALMPVVPPPVAGQPPSGDHTQVA